MKSLLPVLLLFTFACNQHKPKSVQQCNVFTPPVIVQATKLDSMQPWKANSMHAVIPFFIGQFKIADTLFWGEYENRNIDEQQCKWEQQVFTFDTLSSDGLEIYPDYDKTIISNKYSRIGNGNVFFPVYIINRSSIPKLFVAKDNAVFALQEALDTSSLRYYAIEHKAYDFCGNGYFRRKLLPNELIAFLMPKYAGKDTSYIRIRVLIGETVLISKPYKGAFDRRQFKLVNDNLMIKDIAEDNCRSLLYGAYYKKDQY